jgi:hypothetical protein
VRGVCPGRVGSRRGTVGRVVTAAVAGATLVGGLGACTTQVAGTAAPASQAPVAKGGSGGSGGAGGGSTSSPSGSTSPSGGSSGGSAGSSAQAVSVCGRLPKDAATQAFGVSDVQVVPDSAQTLQAGIVEIKCVVNAEGGFRSNVVVQLYPASISFDASQYLTTIKAKNPGVQTLSNVSGADAAGYFQQTVDGALVDTAFAAKKDDDGGLDVLLVGVADSPGVSDKLVNFLNALLND